MKRFSILFVLAVFSAYTFEPPVKPLVPKTKPAPAKKKSIKQLIEEDNARKVETYYDAAHIKSLEQQKIQKHAPMLIIIDQLQGETEKDDNIPMTQELAYGIKRHMYPILVTVSILKNLLARLDKNRQNISELNKELQEFTPAITPQNWRIYDVPESQFVLVVPTSFSALFGSNNGIKPLPNITKLLDGSFNYPLSIWLDKKKKIIPFSKADLEKIFIPKTDTTQTLIWDFIVAGHGTNNPPIIANLSPQLLNEMFEFFDKKIKTGIALIISCYAGGTNRKLLETTQEEVQTNHNFILILGSVSNQTATATFPKDYPYANLFFNNAAQVQDKGSSFDILWEDLAKTKIKSNRESVHGFQNIPQVWFPGGLGFQSADIPDLVFPLGNVLLKKHEENNEPIAIVGDALVLVYPTVINVPLIVYPVSLSHTINKKIWKNIPHVFEPYFTRNNTSVYYKILSQLVIPQLVTTVGFSKPEATSQLFKSLYPQFISLNTTRNAHLFTEINVESTLLDESSKIKGLGSGVIQFIRDAFFDVDSYTNQSIYFIDKLTGFNDISLLLEGSRIVRNDPNKHYLEHYLQNWVGQNINLENVMILINNNNVKFTLYFALDDTYWQYTSTQAEEDAKTLNWWNFKMMGNVRSSYDRDYLKYKTQLVQKPEAINQKSISRVLEEKQRQILLKQTAEIRQKLQPKRMPAPPIPKAK